jgi:hypothetical protein
VTENKKTTSQFPSKNPFFCILRNLLNLQNVMQMKRFKNAREDVLPLVLSIISSETQGGDLKKNLSEI